MTAPERESMEVDVLYVGAGPASLASAYHLVKTCEDRGVEPPAVLVIEKSAEVGDPYALQFQYATKDMEAKLREQSELSYSIVRPTAFFKSVSGQLEVVDGGGPFVYFDLGGGKCATCNPIAEADLAAALIDTIADESKKNALWNLGGPDEGLSMKQQARARAPAPDSHAH